MMHDVYFCKILLQFSKQQKCFGLKSSSKNVSNYWGAFFLKKLRIIKSNLRKGNKNFWALFRNLIIFYSKGIFQL